MRYKKGIFIVYYSQFRWPNFWGKLNHILKVLLNKSFIIETHIDPEDIKEFKRT